MSLVIKLTHLMATLIPNIIITYTKKYNIEIKEIQNDLNKNFNNKYF